MHIIYDDATLEAALTAARDDTSRQLIELIAADAKASELWDLSCMVLVDRQDTAQDFERVLGFAPSTGPSGAAGEAYWSWREQRGGWTELHITAGDSEFAWFVVMPTDWFDARIGRR